jgi:serpin B
MRRNDYSRILCGILMGMTGLTAVADQRSDQSRLAEANTAFAFDLLKQVTREQAGRNVFISPYSVSSVLQMVANGAAGATRAEMEHVLHVDGMKAETANAAYRALDQSIKKEKDAVLNIANSIWCRRGTELKPDFVACNRDFYLATVDLLDFNDPKSASVINDWAAKQTAGRIKDIIQGPISRDTEVFLLNAVYFKGQWAAQFEKERTREQAFHLRPDRERQVRMMFQDGDFEYQERDGVQAVRLPYRGGRLGMVVLLPGTDSSPEKLLATLDAASWDATVMRPLRTRKGMIGLPRFRLERETPLNEPLKNMGIRLAFGRGADFTAMSATPLFLSDVLQKSFVEVNEEGTEAAAVTRGTMSLVSMRPPEEPFRMIVERPFLFLIEDRFTQNLLFMGIVRDPA